MKKRITIEEIKKIIDRLLKATHELAEAHPEAKDDNYFLRVIEGFFRKNTFTLLSIRYLANQPDFADSIIALCRKMTEDVISVEYMLLKGKQEIAKRFQDFFYIQAFQEIELRKKLGYSVPSREELVGLNSRIEKLKPMFWHEKSNSFQRSWSGMEAERMLIELAKAKVFNKHDIHILLLSYTYGSWNNHPNPVDTITYMTNELRTQNNEYSLMQATILSIMSFIRLTTRYIDEIRYTKQENVYDDVAKAVKDIFQRLDSEEYVTEKNI